MGLFIKLLSKLSGGTTPSLLRAPVTVDKQQNTPRVTATITPTVRPMVQVLDADVAERVSGYDFVLTTDPPSLKASEQWWNEDTHKRRRREGSQKAFSWLLPFISLEVAKLERLQSSQECGPHGAKSIAKELRALIRERRKANQPIQELLCALYGTCIAADLSDSLEFEGIQPYFMARFVDINELRPVQLDFRKMGYQFIKSLSKTDVKWLVEAYGEPDDHKSFDAMWPHIRRNAVARYCWSELRSVTFTDKSLSLPHSTMQEWLNKLVRRNISSYKEWQEHVAKRQANLAERAKVLDQAWAATHQPFVVADLETTGLNPETDEVIEFAAILVTPKGHITGEFSTLVRPSRLVPAATTRLTGITQAVIDRKGRYPNDAIKEFVQFVGTHPVFFHNAPFDEGFIKKAATHANVKWINPVHDTLPLARQAWPSLDSYKLAMLAEHVGAKVPKHRALEDAKATLAVLLAARQTVTSKK
jgi:DNA polymerase-3 subunit epsilon